VAIGRTLHERRLIALSPAPTGLVTPPAGTWLRLAPGLLVSVTIAALSVYLGRLPWLLGHGFSALTLAIVIGILLGNSLYPLIGAACGPGVGFSRQWLLRIGVVLYGMRLTGQDISHVGVSGVLIDAVVIASTIVLGYFLGTRALGMDRKTVLLIALGNSICGAAAVMAAETTVRARTEQVTVAIATVVVFGTAAIFLYPALFDLNRHWGLIGGGLRGFGIYIGSTVHEVAQVIAAARPVGVEAGDTAVITKMVRVMMLAPVLLGLSWWMTRERTYAGDGLEPGPTGIVVPWFALAFIAAIGFNSLRLLPLPVVAWINDADGLILATAMSALGLSTHASSIRRAGIKPLLLAGILFAWLVLGGAAINHGLAALRIP
jgi:uncharacterized integral membrane protein (TIGR00698 family)